MPQRPPVRPARRAAIALAGLAALAAGAQAQSPAADGPRAYVSHQGGDLGVIDLTTMQPLHEIDVQASEPRGLGVTDDGKLLVSANRENSNISVIDRATGQVLRQVKIGVNPEFVRVKGRLAFVSFEPSSTGGPPPKMGASAPAKAEGGETKGEGKGGPEGKEGAGGHDDDDDGPSIPARVAVVDLDKGKVVREIIGGPELEGIEFSADGKRLLVTNERDNTVTVHDIASGKRVKTIDTTKWGTRPRGIKRSPDGKHYVATLEHGNSFIVMDGNYKVLKSVATGESPYGVAFDRAGERLFVAASRAKLLQVFDTKDWNKVAEVPIGARCWHFTFTPDDRQILVACGRSDDVVVVDAQTLQPTKKIPAGKMPWGIVTYPKSIGSLDAP